MLTSNGVAATSSYRMVDSMIKNEKHFKKRTKSWDAAAKKNRYKKSRDK